MKNDGEQKGRPGYQRDYRQPPAAPAATSGGGRGAPPSAKHPINEPALQVKVEEATQYQTTRPAAMIAPKQKILIKQGRRRRLQSVAAALLWPLVICSLLQLSANLLYIINEPAGAGVDSQCAARPLDASASASSAASSTWGVEVGRADSGIDVLGGASAVQKLFSSSTAKISSPPSKLYSQDATQCQQQAASSSWRSALHLSLSRFFKSDRSIWGGRVLMAQAISLYQANQDKGIIILNSSNLYPELLQTRHPFPHMKLIEYYVSHCGVCARFKNTYTKLAKAIHPWRNVMRPAAIDLGVSNNSPVAQAWHIRVIPALTINPPPETGLAQRLDGQLSNWSTTMQPIELHKSMFAQYNSSYLFVQPLNVSRYMEKMDLLKADLLVHIENYVRNNSANLPATWPNLRPVTETTLATLRRDHPRQELFLLIEGGSVPDNQLAPAAAAASSGQRSNLGLTVMMELSTSSAWKSIRYMRANENKALLEDVIMEQRRACELTASVGAPDSACMKQVELLNNLLSSKPIEANNMLLIHIDGSYGPANRAAGGPAATPAFPLMRLLTETALSNMDQAGSFGPQQQQPQQESSNADRAKRAINHLTRQTRSLSNSGTDKMTTERVVDLIVQYIKLTYVETSEDRNFVNAINNLTNDNVRATQEDKNDWRPTGGAPTSSGQTGAELTSTTTSSSSFMTHLSHISDMFNTRDKSHHQHIQRTPTNYSFPIDYEDKLKAIHHMLFSEIPSSYLHTDKSSQDQQDRLNTLINLVSVIKSYFPLPDASSIQFIAGVHAYLIKQARLSSITNQGRTSAGAGASGVGVGGGGATTSFDVSAYKQELKRLELDNKRLPEVKEFKLCVDSGYPCALWRLFHTLAAFEHKKLSQIRRQAAAPTSGHLHSSASLLQQHQQQPHPDSSFPPSGSSLSGGEVITTMKSPPTGSSHDEGRDGGLPSPVERLVSPPSTTTSLSLTIATPTSSSSQQQQQQQQQLLLLQQQSLETNSNNGPMNEADLPTPVLLVMRDYITTFFACPECRQQFGPEWAGLSLERIRQQEPAEFSVLWLWNMHNQVTKRLAMKSASLAKRATSIESSSPPPRVWFPTYQQCVSCYLRPPSFQQSLPAVDQETMFQESIEWNEREILAFLTREYLRDPLERSPCGLFENQLLYIGLLGAISCSCLLFMLVHRCTALYLERQRRHKANILNGNGAHTYSLALNE